VNVTIAIQQFSAHVLKENRKRKILFYKKKVNLKCLKILQKQGAFFCHN